MAFQEKRGEASVMKMINDVENSRKDRSAIISFLNAEVLGSGARIDFAHKFCRMFPLHQKKKNNKLMNRIHPGAGINNAMGLDCLLSVEWTHEQIPIILRRKADPDIYYKLVNNLAMDEFTKVYLSRAYFLFLDSFAPDKCRTYALIKGDQFDWFMNNYRGNKNRMVMITRTGKTISPKNDLFWIDIFKGGKGLFDNRPELKAALLSLFPERRVN